MKKHVLLILIIVLVIANIAAVTVLLHNREAAADDTDTGSKAEPVSINVTMREKPCAVVVDYDTKSSQSVIEKLEEADFDVDRIEDIKSLDMSKYDALVIPGGNNITPSVYGAERDEHTYKTNLEKDHLQIEAVQMFARAGKPVLGVCRGEQLVNVAFGGTIDQHIPGWHKYYRDVKIQEGTWLYDEFGDTVHAYHFHHQCVEKLGKGLVATQWDAEDGRIEGYVHESLPVYGLQWHPDGMDDGDGLVVFKSFREIVKFNMFTQYTREYANQFEAILTNEIAGMS